MNEQEIVENIRNAEEKAIEDACKALRGYESQVVENLAKIVASLCGITVYEVLEDTTRVFSKHARWFYWFAYKYMTNESCEAISKRDDKYKHFHHNSISSGISNMSMMISEQPIWAKRWSIVKRIILQINNVEKQDIKVKIQHPKGVNIEIKQE
jgi:hypothetical protein